MPLKIKAYERQYRQDVLALSLRAWAPVFDQLQKVVESYVYEAFYPNGWRTRQSKDIESFLDEDGHNVWVASDNGHIVGWVGVRLHDEDGMGEIYILAVDPGSQRQGVARLLMETAFHYLKESGMKIVMVETGDDPGHAPSRAAYESAGFERWPVARYFREI
jgi:ribosomal protein S18 acetylase RimI-like enzyme